MSLFWIVMAQETLKLYKISTVVYFNKTYNICIQHQASEG